MSKEKIKLNDMITYLPVAVPSKVLTVTFTVVESGLLSTNSSFTFLEFSCTMRLGKAKLILATK